MSPLNAAWQAALAAEHQAVFGYGLLGVRLRGTQQQLAVACSNAHEALRDATEAAMTEAQLRPEPPQADYPALYPVSDAAQARALAVRLEDECAAAWRYLYAQAARARATERLAEAQSALTSSAVRAVRWRALASPDQASVAFPGV
jgi:uncharacterized protein DUF4439